MRRDRPQLVQAGIRSLVSTNTRRRSWPSPRRQGRQEGELRQAPLLLPLRFLGALGVLAVESLRISYRALSDSPRVAEGGDRRVVVAEGLQDRVGVLAEEGRRQRHI